MTSDLTDHNVDFGNLNWDGDKAIPPGITNNAHVVALAHTHGAFDGDPNPNPNREIFSTRDKVKSNAWRVPIYVVTPQGFLRKYDNKTQKVRIISSNMPYE